MAFTLPTFNLNVNLWRWATPVGNPPDLTFQANLSCAKGRSPYGVFSFTGKDVFLLRVELLCPKLTDIRGHTSTNDGDRVEVPAGSGRQYAVTDVEDVAKGFQNEYRLATLLKICGSTSGIVNTAWSGINWPEPTP